MLESLELSLTMIYALSEQTISSTLQPPEANQVTRYIGLAPNINLLQAIEHPCTDCIQQS